MPQKLPWWRVRDPETGGTFITRSPFYTWDTGWGVFDPDYKIGPEGERYLELQPLTPSLSGTETYGSVPYDYTTLRVRMNTDPDVPKPREFRPQANAQLYDLMLRMVSVKNAPVIGGPFNSGLMKTRSKTGQLKYAGKIISREDVYKDRIKFGEPTDFAIIVRDQAERWRQRRDYGLSELAFLKRVFYDLAQEGALVYGIPLSEAEGLVVMAFGGDPFARSTRRMRKPKPTKKEG